jgi:hypothetical protein
MNRNKSEPEPATLFDIARSGLDEAGGRWAEQDARVIGSAAAAGSAYPAASAAQSDLVGEEPALGEAVADVIPTGTPAEIEASLARIERNGDA